MYWYVTSDSWKVEGIKVVEQLKEGYLDEGVSRNLKRETFVMENSTRQSKRQAIHNSRMFWHLTLGKFLKNNYNIRS